MKVFKPNRSSSKSYTYVTNDHVIRFKKLKIFNTEANSLRYNTNIALAISRVFFKNSKKIVNKITLCDLQFEELMTSKTKTFIT